MSTPKLGNKMAGLADRLKQTPSPAPQKVLTADEVEQLKQEAPAAAAAVPKSRRRLVFSFTLSPELVAQLDAEAQAHPMQPSRSLMLETLLRERYSKQ